MSTDPSTLNSRKLRLSASIETRTLPDGIRLMKQTARAQYLALTPEQQKIIDRFDGEQNLQDILHSLLVGGVCASIRGFYELVLNAMGKGFLFIGDTEPSVDQVVGRQWGVRWGGAASLVLAIVMIALGVCAFAAAGLKLPGSGLEWVGVLLTVVLALSLGNLFAGCVLSGFGRQVYLPRVRWDRGLPYFAIDGRDAFMGGRFCEACVALHRIAAAFLVGGVAWFFDSTTGLLGSVVAVMLVTLPFGNTPAHALLYALLREEYQFGRCGARFLSSKLIAQAIQWKEPIVEEKYLFIYGTYAMIWMAVVGQVAFRFLEKHAVVLVRNLRHPVSLTSELASAAGLGVLVAAIAVPLGFVVWLLLKNCYRVLAPYWFSAESSLTRASARKTRPPVEEVARFLGKTLLFSQLQPDELKKVAGTMMFTTADPGTIVMRERDIGNVLCVVYSGEVEVLKETVAGDSVVVARLRAGDVFGEIALLDRVPRTSTVRCSQSACLLVLSRAHFEELLLESLGPGRIRTIVQVCAFLRRNPLFIDWSPQGLMGLSREFAFQPIGAGDTVIREGQANESFFLVYEGRFEVRKQGKPCATLGPGDFCGEISLLRNLPASADVVALQAGRCLRLGKEQFLKFVSQSFLTGFMVDEAVESRLKRVEVA